MPLLAPDLYSNHAFRLSLWPEYCTEILTQYIFIYRLNNIIINADNLFTNMHSDFLNSSYLKCCYHARNLNMWTHDTSIGTKTTRNGLLTTQQSETTLLLPASISTISAWQKNTWYSNQAPSTEDGSLQCIVEQISSRFAIMEREIAWMKIMIT